MPGKELAEEEQRAVLVLYDRGLGTWEISRRTGFPRARVVNVLTGSNVLRSRQAAQRARADWWKGLLERG